MSPTELEGMTSIPKSENASVTPDEIIGDTKPNEFLESLQTPEGSEKLIERESKDARSILGFTENSTKDAENFLGLGSLAQEKDELGKINSELKDVEIDQDENAAENPEPEKISSIAPESEGSPKDTSEKEKKDDTLPENTEYSEEVESKDEEVSDEEYLKMNAEDEEFCEDMGLEDLTPKQKKFAREVAEQVEQIRKETAGIQVGAQGAEGLKSTPEKEEDDAHELLLLMLRLALRAGSAIAISIAKKIAEEAGSPPEVLGLVKSFETVFKKTGDYTETLITGKEKPNLEKDFLNYIRKKSNKPKIQDAPPERK